MPPGGDENFQTPRDRNRIVISRGSRPVCPQLDQLSLSPLPLDWSYTPKVLAPCSIPLFFHLRSLSFRSPNQD